MKKRYLFLIFLLSNVLSAFNQIEQPVTFQYGKKYINQKEVVVFIKANIESDWHIYSLDSPDGGPVKTSIKFTNSNAYDLKGKIYSRKPVEVYMKPFKLTVGYFEKSVIFQQRILLKSKLKNIHGVISYQACNDKKCLPPQDLDFDILM